MTKWLASVRSLQEVQALDSLLPDILDMKNPSTGALGALSVTDVEAIVRFVDGRCQTSATVGDLDMDAEIIKPAIVDMAGSGVDLVKIGLFPDGNLMACLNDLTETLQSLNKPVIAVIFADQPIEESVWLNLGKIGFKGVMVDTAAKNGQHLLDHWSIDQLDKFVSSIHDMDLLCGLAGALRLEDIETLGKLGADYLGFRSALCKARKRVSDIDLARVAAVQHQISALSSPS